MRLDEIEELILELLAAEAKCSVADVRDELRAGGETWPLDSLLAAEVVTAVQERVGVVLPATAETARALRSVHTFAVAVYELLPAGTSARDLSA